MTERPILFTPENAQKVHVGTKTQTRRIMKNQDKLDIACPYGLVGDRLWVREAHALYRGASVPTGLSDATYCVFRDGGQSYKSGGYVDPLREYAPGAFAHMKFRPSIHMPRWACRTVLEITEIRVEQVQQITYPDAIAEGMDTTDPLVNFMDWWQNRWSEIHGSANWYANPYVWVLSFRRLEP